jgi:hypothetical protein
MPTGVYERTAEQKQRLAQYANCRKGKKYINSRLTCKYGHPLTEDNLTGGKRRRCKICRRNIVEKWRLANPEKVAAKTRRWRKNNTEKDKLIRRRSVLKRQYKLTPEKVKEMFELQGRKCANLGCGSTSPGRRGWDWSIDHNHTTLKVRGILCNGCNAALGFLHENKERILGLAEYLKKYEEEKCLDILTGLSSA